MENDKCAEFDFPQQPANNHSTCNLPGAHIQHHANEYDDQKSQATDYEHDNKWQHVQKIRAQVFQSGAKRLLPILGHGLTYNTHNLSG